MFANPKRETCYPPTFGHRLVYIRGDAANFPIEPVGPLEPLTQK